MESHINRMVPENAPHYRHTLKVDDMPAQYKSFLFE